jgi:hemoglobin-like flavoprotein
MTDSIQLFVDSYARVGAKDRETSGFFDAFYSEFVNSSPEVATKFRGTDMVRQREMLRVSLDHMVYFAIDKEETSEIARVAKVHSQAQTDIPEYLYELWLESLLKTVSKFDPQYSPVIESAWREALGPAIGYMQGHYKTD